MPTNVTDQLISWLRERERVGKETYGAPLTTFNGRDALKDALEEALDLTQYLFQAILERDQLLTELARANSAARPKPPEDK